MQWPEFVIYITGGSLSKKLVMNFLDITTTHIFTFKDLLCSVGVDIADVRLLLSGFSVASAT